MRPTGRVMLVGLVCVVLGLAPAAADESAAWKEAMQLSDQQRYDEALKVIRAGLARDPADTDLQWLEAGVLGWADRHAESVEHYKKLVRDHPELADEVRIDLATQKLWAGDPLGALADAETELSRDPSNAKAARLRALALAHSDQYRRSLEAYDDLLIQDPGDVQLALDRAMVLSWMGKNTRAVEAYDEILDAHPDSTRARIGVAQNENWRGNHRRAVELYEELLTDGHTDPEIFKGLAYANYWSDRPEAARAALDRYAAVRPADREGRHLSTMLRFEDDPTLTAGFETADDSDDMRIHTLTLDYRLPLAHRTALMVFAREDRVEDPGGTENPLRVGVGVEKRWADRWRSNARVAYFDPRNSADGRGLVQASLAYRTNSRVNCALGFENEPVLSRESLTLGIRSTNVGAAVSFRPVERVTLSGSAQYRDYSDGNQAWLTSAGAKWNVPSRRKSRVALLFGADLLRSDQDLNNGYYDPEQYIEFGPGVEWTREFHDRATLGLRAQTGYQKEKGSDGDSFYKVGGVAEIPLGKALRLTIEVGRSNSSLSSQSGYERTVGAVRLTRAF